MTFFFRQFLSRIRSNFWFIPTMLGLGGVTLALASLHYDRIDAVRSLEESLPLSGIGPNGVRAALGVIAGGMMTVTSLVFSLTFVALTTLSGQLGPRILLFFMQDRAAKIVMGLFIGTFAFSLLALASTGESGSAAPPPRLTFLIAITLAIVSLGAVIYFVDHMAHAMQADQIVAGLGAKLDAAIARSIREEAGENDASEEERRDFAARVARDQYRVRTERAGYVESIDYAGLVRLAASHDARLHLHCEVNGFVFDGACLAAIDMEEGDIEDLATKVRSALAIGKRRVPSQHANFEMDALTEVSLRALSPGINDPFTAAAAITQLGNALARMARAVPLQPLLADDEGTWRLLRPVEDLPSYLDKAFAPILAASDGSPIALEALVDALAFLNTSAHDERDRRVIVKYLEAVDTAIETDVGNARVREALRDRIASETGRAQG